MGEGLRERQRRETRHLVRRAAVELVTARGLADVTVHDIAEAAGISQRTFFNHFATKEAALVPPLPPLDEATRLDFVQAREPDLVTALGDLLAAHTALVRAEEKADPADPDDLMPLIKANPELLPRLLSILADFEEHLTDLLVQRLGLPPRDPGARLIAATAMATARIVMESGPPPPDAARNALLGLRAHLTSSAG